MRDGKTVNIWNDKWIPRLEGKLLQPKCIGCPNFPRKVEGWMDKEEGEWNWRMNI